MVSRKDAAPPAAKLRIDTGNPERILAPGGLLADQTFAEDRNEIEATGIEAGTPQMSKARPGSEAGKKRRGQRG